MLQALLCWGGPAAASVQEQYCESLPAASNHTGECADVPLPPVAVDWRAGPGGQGVALDQSVAHFSGVPYVVMCQGDRQKLQSSGNLKSKETVMMESNKLKIHYKDILLTEDLIILCNYFLLENTESGDFFKDWTLTEINRNIQNSTSDMW
uniref:Uncharacterized protein n=1 Tax=Nothoprocta perdicaria TaxID=30464 RepID=A0A8C6ZF89_NOTPE